MRHKSQEMDYEPLTRGGKRTGPSEDEFGDGLFKDPFSKSQSPAMPRKKEVVSKAPSRPQTSTVKSVLKRGHGLSFAGLFLFIALVYFRPYEWSPSLMFLSTSAFWVAVLTLAVYVPTQLGLENKLTIRPREVNLVLLLALTGLLSIPLALDPLTAWTALVEYLKVIVMFIVMVNVVRTEKRLRILLFLALVTSVVVSASAVNDYRLGNLALGQKERIEGALGNLFQNPNDLALYLNTMIPIAFGFFLGTRAITKKLFYIALVILFVAGVLCTTSRGGFIGLACVIVVLAAKLTHRYRLLLGVTAVLVVLLVFVLAPGGLRSRLAKGSDDASTVARTDDLKRSVFLMVRHPIFGLGMNNYIFYSNSAHATHNAYTQIGAEMGVPALLFYILFLVTPLRRLSKLRRSRKDTETRRDLRYICLGIEASLIAYMVTSFFLSVAYLWYAYFLVGYAVTLRRLISPSEFEPEQLPGHHTAMWSLKPSETSPMARNSTW